MRLQMAVTAAMLALSFQCLPAQQPSGDSAIRSVLARETEGWDKFDAKEVASVFTEDAIWQNPFGVRLHGRSERDQDIALARIQALPKSWIFVLHLPPLQQSGAMNASKGS